jgi:DNA-binding response OmpR family regulator
MAALILLVDANRTTLGHTHTLLARRGYLVAPVREFASAAELLRTVSPDLLVVDFQHDVSRALELANASHRDDPRRPMIFTHASRDPFVEREAHRLGATYLLRPWNDDIFLAHVAAVIADHRWVRFPVRRWKRKRISNAVTLRAGGVTAHVVDVSYGGLRLAFPNPLPESPATFALTLPATQLSFEAHRVWSHAAPTGSEVWCGVEFAHPDGEEASRWRAFVDSLT